MISDARTNGGTLTPVRDTAGSHRLIRAKVEANAKRRNVLHCVKEGHIKVAQLRGSWRDEKAYSIITVKMILRAVRGPKWADRVCQQENLDPDQKISRLGDAQWHRLIARTDGARR